MSNSPCDLGVVILNWNTRDLLRDCLCSVVASRGLSLRVCVVDNASSDGSADMVAAEFPQVLLVRSPRNDGYAAGNNRGLRALGFERGGQPDARHALLLNPDTVVPADGLARLVAHLEAHPEVGVAGPKIVLPDGSLDLACRRSFPTPEVSFYRLTGLSKLFPKSRLFGRYNLTYLDPDQETEVDAVVGACMLVRGEAIVKAGLLDEKFFMYGEDLDWALEIRKAGWRACYFPDVTILHVKRAASRRSSRAQIAFHEAMLYFYDKHYRGVTNPLVGALVVLGIRLNLALTRARETLIPRDL
jgi:hypothetical protein